VTAPEPAVRITLHEIYREVQELRDIVRPMACDLADLRERFELVEANAIPWRWLAKAGGAVLLAVSIVGGLWGIFGK